MAIRGILFDKDGTLIDYHASWMPANRAAAMAAADGDPELAGWLLEQGGYDPAAARIRAGTTLAAGTNREIAELFSRLAGPAAPPDLEDRVEQIFSDSGRNSVLVPDTRETLAALRPLLAAMGIATHDSEAGIAHSLAPHDVLHHFDFLCGHDSGHGHKPGPDMALAFCAATGLEPAEICVIGDNTHDLLMGRSAGAGLVIGVLTGTSRREDLLTDSDLVLDSIALLTSERPFLDRLPAKTVRAG